MSGPLVTIDVPDTRQLPVKLRLMAATFPCVTMTVSAEMARDVERAIDAGLTAAQDQERILQQAEQFRAKGLGAAREVLERAEARHRDAERMLAEAQARLRGAQWLLACASVIGAALLAVLFGL